MQATFRFIDSGKHSSADMPARTKLDSVKFLKDSLDAINKSLHTPIITTNRHTIIAADILMVIGILTFIFAAIIGIKQLNADIKRNCKINE